MLGPLRDHDADPRTPQHLCACGAPLFARYDLERRPRLAPRQPVRSRAHDVAYRELMPVFAGEAPVTLGEGFTPLVHARTLGARLGLDRLYIKDESLNPTNSFKARGQSAAVTRARGLGVSAVSVPSAGNAGNALAAYAARAGLERTSSCRARRMAVRARVPIYGAEVTLVDGLITDAAASQRSATARWAGSACHTERTVSRRRQEYDGL